MKKILIILLLLTFTINVDANICDGKSMVSSEYCDLGAPITYSDARNYSLGTGTAIGHFYNITSTPESADYGFCIDPGLADPISSNGWKYVRPLDLTTSYDQNFYRIYQHYVNKIATGSNAYETREEIGVFLRTTTISDEISISENKSELNNAYLYKIQPYMENLSSSINLSGTSYAGAASKMSEFRTMYQKMKNKPAQELWGDPLTIIPTITYEEKEQLYTFNFEIQFVKGTSQYFYNNTTNLINGDYDIGFGDAYFTYSLRIGNDDYRYDMLNAEEYSDGINVTKGPINSGEMAPVTITKNTSNANSTRNVYLKMSKETYDAINNNHGTVEVRLEYSTYHPMSSDNVFLNYINERENNESATHQRMIVFSKFINKSYASSNGTSKSPEKKSLCAQDGTKFYYDGIEVGLEEYKSQCSCARINKSEIITGSRLEEEYNTLCPPILEEDYNETLTSCTSENPLGQGQATHTKKESINSYCSLKCDEIINISGLIGNNLTVQAGRYFKLETYPNLDAVKKCTMTVEYTSWYNNYKMLLQDQIDSMNKINYNNAVNNATKYATTCGRWPNTYPGTSYSWSYTYYYLDRSGNVQNRTESGSYSSCNNSTPSLYNNPDLEFITSINNIEQHFANLKTCNNHPNIAIDSTSDFYNLSADLSFYYQQKYAKSGALFFNNNKPNSEVDDSPFMKVDSNKNQITPIPEEAESTYKTYQENTKSYEYFNREKVQTTYNVGIDPPLVGGQYKFTREANYNINYYPSINKFGDMHTGKISNNSTTLNNPITLGNVYNIDISALPGIFNNYYSFLTLGHNNEIAKYYKNNPSKGNLERVCTYEITNEIITSNKDPKIIFRSVNPSNIDPNNRLGIKGFKNWDNTKGLVVKKAIETADTFNPNNIEYSFTLDTKTMQEIRELNADSNYLDFNFKCNSTKGVEGNECISEFVTKYADYEGEAPAGRSKWKYLVSDRYADEGFVIQEFKTGEMKQDTFNNLLLNEKLGGLTP